MTAFCHFRHKMGGENKQLQESGKNGYMRYVQKMGLVKSEFKSIKTFDRYIWKQSLALVSSTVQSFVIIKILFLEISQ